MITIKELGLVLLAPIPFFPLLGCGGGAELIPPPTVTITATPSSIVRGDSSILRWESANADRVVESNFGATGVSGTKTVSPTETTTYTITVAGNRGQASQSVTVTVGEPNQPTPPGVSLTADPSTINAGQSTTLRWDSTNADTVVESNFGAATLSGTIQVSPTATTTYYIIVSGPGGQARQDATVTVIALSTPPRASFTITPATGDVNTVFQFDASGCNDDQDPASALKVRWDWEDDGAYDTDYSTTKTATHQYASRGTNTIRLQVKDTSDLTDTTTRSLTVGPYTSPTARFTVTPTSGDVNTVFQFDASGSTDAEDPATALQVRWDWENDGAFDTVFSAGKTATHQYTSAGSKTIKLEVRDSDGLTGTATNTVVVKVAVTIQPQTATVSVGKTQTFTATVAGSTNTAVTWSVQEGTAGGSITSGGVYTAPNTAGTYHVLATSVADATVSATATVTVQSGIVDVIVN